MNIREAIGRIKIHKQIHFLNEPRAIKITEALNMAIDAMEKQVAKNTTRYDNCGNYTASERCPNCFEIVNTNYCGECGQRVK